MLSCHRCHHIFLGMECWCLKIWHLNVDSLKWIKISRSLKVTVTNSSELLAQKSVKPEPGGQGGHWPPQYLADQLTLFQLGEGRLSPPISTGPPNVFHLPASLEIYYSGKSHLIRFLRSCRGAPLKTSNFLNQKRERDELISDDIPNQQ